MKILELGFFGHLIRLILWHQTIFVARINGDFLFDDSGGSSSLSKDQYLEHE